MFAITRGLIHIPALVYDIDMAINPMKSWSISFLREWLPYMSLGSVVRWRDYHIRDLKGNTDGAREIVLDLKYPISGNVSMREASSDISTFQEVAVQQIY